MNEVKLFTATKALVTHNGKILLLRESGGYKDGTQTGRYDVPGGRITPGENFMASLRREVQEESGLTIGSATPFFVNEVRIQKHGEEWQIIRIFFICDSDTDQVTLSEDHDDYLWIDPKDFASVNIIGNLHEVFESYLTSSPSAR